MQKLIEYLQDKELIKNHPLFRYPDIDVPGFTGFSLFPENVGKAGEIIFLVGNEKVLISGSKEDFSFLMQDLLTTGSEISLEKFALLYIRFYKLQHGILLHPETITDFNDKKEFFSNQYTEQEFRYDKTELFFNFWILNTDAFMPVHVSGIILSSGEIKSY